MTARSPPAALPAAWICRRTVAPFILRDVALLGIDSVDGAEGIAARSLAAAGARTRPRQARGDDLDDQARGRDRNGAGDRRRRKFAAGSWSMSRGPLMVKSPSSWPRPSRLAQSRRPVRRCLRSLALLRLISAAMKSMKARTRADCRRSGWVSSHRPVEKSGLISERRTRLGLLSAMKQGRGPMPVPLSTASASPSTVFTL